MRRARFDGVACFDGLACCCALLAMSRCDYVGTWPAGLRYERPSRRVRCRVRAYVQPQVRAHARQRVRRLRR